MWRGTGAGNPGVMGMGSVREAGEERTGSRIPKGVGPIEIGNKFYNIAQFCRGEKH